MYDYVDHNQPQAIDTVPHKYILNHLIGAAFSLWRAVFLADSFRYEVTVHQDQKRFLAKVIADNSITFADDRTNRRWAVDYYLENAKFRIAQASTMSDHHSKTNTHEVMHYLCLRGMFGIALTRYEWECAHFALRTMLKVLDPSTKLQPAPPSSPRPTELESIFEKQV